MTLYPETEKLERVNNYWRKSGGGAMLSTRVAKCRRCKQDMPVGTEVVWLRGAGTYHRQNPCPVLDEPTEA